MLLASYPWAHYRPQNVSTTILAKYFLAKYFLAGRRLAEGRRLLAPEALALGVVE